MLDPFALHAVLTGDVIGSSSLKGEESDRLVEMLHETFDRARAPIDRESSEDWPVETAFEVFRGDSWQLYVSDPSLGLCVALAFRAWFRVLSGADTRMALAVGPARQLNLIQVGHSQGPAFEDSGHRLDALGRRTFDCVIRTATSDSTRQRLFDVMASAVGAFAADWTRAQAQAVAFMLTLEPMDGEYPQQAQIAEAWPPEPIRQQTVSGHLGKAHWSELSNYLEIYESELSDIVTDWIGFPR